MAFQACRSLFVNGDIEVCIDDTASEGHFAFLSAVDQFRVPLHVTSDPELLVMLLNKVLARLPSSPRGVDCGFRLLSMLFCMGVR